VLAAAGTVAGGLLAAAVAGWRWAASEAGPPVAPTATPAAAAPGGTAGPARCEYVAPVGAALVRRGAGRDDDS
jgi:hypothetical protein